MSDERKPLWSNMAIGIKASEATDELDGGPYVYHAISQLLVKMRGDYEAELSNQYQRIAALEAEARDWRQRHAECTTSLITEVRKTERLEARLAQTWQPLPDGEYGNVMVARNGEVLSVLERDGLLDESFWSGRFIADDIRLCRLVESQPQPDWSSAPEWAQWWSVDADGEATFWQNKPDVIYIRGMWHDDGECLVACDLDLPIGIDWRTTLRQRPTEVDHE